MSNETKAFETDLAVLEATARAGLRSDPRHLLRLIRIARAASKVAERLGSSPTNQALHDALAEVTDDQPSATPPPAATPSDAVIIPRKLFTMTVDAIELAITGMDCGIEHKKKDWIAFALTRDVLSHLRVTLAAVDQ